MTVVRRVAGLGVGGAILLPSVHWPGRGDEAELRVSLRLPAVTTEAGRPPTGEEVRGVPPHMRPAEICSGEVVSFGMRVVVDGDTLDAGTVRPPGGGRGRTLSVYRSYRTAGSPRRRGGPRARLLGGQPPGRPRALSPDEPLPRRRRCGARHAGREWGTRGEVMRGERRPRRARPAGTLPYDGDAAVPARRRPGGAR